ncbi:MAG: ubiquinone-binding protein [Proteobacteria bacterium]|nr:MAG: ubiquinone-binding protein [Pseudomonadota bacterium]
MPSINRSALVPFSAEQMFQLVDDISAYPEFLPWCGGAEEHKRDETQVQASVTIQKGTINKAFTTLNTLEKPHLIKLTLLDGPFKKLQGFWRFDEFSEDACKVILNLEFEFSNRLVGMALGPVFNQVANTFVDSFVARAKVVYGNV